MAALFISYRRSDSQEAVGRIYDRLKEEFPADQVFRDLDSIPLGRPFPDVLREAVMTSDAILIVIGPGWISATGTMGSRRLDDPTDFVRAEVELALTSKVPVIPVLVSGAAMPTAEELPDSLRPLVHHQAIQLRSDPDFHRDMDRLIASLPQRVASSLKPKCYACSSAATTRCQSCGVLSCATNLTSIYVQHGQSGAYELRCKDCHSSAMIWRVVSLVAFAIGVLMMLNMMANLGVGPFKR